MLAEKATARSACWPLFFAVAIAAAFLHGCSDSNPLQKPGTPGTPSGEPPVACPGGVGSNAAVTLATPLASRTSGVAPLAVFFDATGTTGTDAPNFTEAFLSVEYRWDFGDASSGNWGDKATGAPGTGVNTSRNVAYGPVAAHVFETPGTYTVCVRVTSTGGVNVADGAVTITVEDPDVVFATNTLCVHPTVMPVANADGCPAGATGLVSADLDALLAANISTKKRILLRRGQIFLSSVAATINVPGPGILGVYGAGTTKAIVRSAGAVSRIGISSISTPTTSDWRIMDLELDGESIANSNGVFASGSASQITFLRIDAHDLKFGFVFDPNVLDLQNTPTFISPMWDQIAIVDSSIQRLVGDASSGSNACFCASARFSVMGNLIDNNFEGEHGLRAMYIGKGVINNNVITRIRDAKANLTIRSRDFAGTPTLPAGTYTEQVVISDNKLIGGPADGIGGTGPNNDTSDGRVRWQIWERNWVVFGTGTTFAITLEGVSITYRNNITDASTGLGGVGVGAMTSSIAPDASDIRIYNNSFFRSDAGATTFRPILMQAGASNIIIQNNLAYGPATVSPVMITDIGASSVTTCANCNSSNAEITGSNPNFAATPPTTPSDWVLTGGSYAINRGVPVPVFSDFLRAARPQGGARDIGATEQ